MLTETKMTEEESKLTEHLKQYRDKIDNIDVQIQNLIQERARLAIKIGQVKRDFSKDVTFYRPQREERILQAVVQRNQGQNQGPLTNAHLVTIFGQILLACRNLQQPVKVAFLGPEGTYSHRAVLQYFKQNMKPVTAASFAEIFDGVENGSVDYGVVPIANSTTGLIPGVCKTLLNSKLKICGDVILPICHQLLTAKDTTVDLSKIKRVYSHEQSLKQCVNWLKKHLPDAEISAVYSNAFAAQMAAQDNESAVIASSDAASIYGLQILAENIQDLVGNATRFIIVSKLCLNQTPI